MIRGLILSLSILLLAACASGSGRQGTQIDVTGVGPSASVGAGANTAFVMTVKNVGEYPASDVKLVDNVGNQLKLESITCTAAGGAVCPTAPSVSMIVNSLPSGGSLIFTVNVQLAANASGIIQNTMSASFAQQINAAQGSFSATGTAVTLTTNIVVGGTGPTGNLVAGQQAVFVMTVTNNGPDAAGAFNVYDSVGAGLKYVGIVCTAANGAVCPASSSQLTPISGLVSGGVLTFTVTTQVGQLANGPVTNELVVNVATNPNQAENSFTVTANVDSAILSLTATPPGALAVGATGVFTLVVTNPGPGVASMLTITNALSATAMVSGPITCVASGDPTAACPTAPGAIMTVPTLPVFGVLTFTVPFTVVATGAITDTLTVASPTDPNGSETVSATAGGAATSGLTVTETGQSTVAAGQTALFNAVITNLGPGVATNIVVTDALAGLPAGTVVTVTGCTPPVNGSCPVPLGTSMTVPSLGIGRAISFTYSVPVPLSAAGGPAIVNTVTATPSAGAAASGSYSSLPVNQANGTYQVFAADGNQYLMTVDFDNPTIVITGSNIQQITEHFTTDGSGTYTVTGNQQFRIADNLIVGGQNFGTGTGAVEPYIAVNLFSTRVAVLQPAYNIGSIEYPADGSGPITVAGTARVSGNTLEICMSASVPVTPVQSCPAAALQSYTLAVNGNLFVATNTGTGPSFTFQVALNDALATILATGALPDGNNGLLIGLVKAAAIADVVSQGSSRPGGDWVTMTLTPNSYSVVDNTANTTDSAPLAPPSSTTGPFSLLQGPRASDGALIYVMQALPYSIEFGASAGAASGQIQITIP